MKVRKKWNSNQKAKIVMEGLKGRPVVDICNDYGMSQTLYYKWKEKFLAGAADIFESKQRDSKEMRLLRENNKLKQCLAEVTLELKKTEEDW